MDKQIHTADAEQMLERYADTVYKIAKARVGPRGDADDIFQEVFLAYLRYAPVFRDEEHGKAWFIRVACNTANSYWRQARHRHEAPLEALQLETGRGFLGQSQESFAGERLRAMDLEACLEELKEGQRELIHLFYYEGLRSKDIALIKERKEGAIRMALSRARQALKACLEGGQSR